jgi:hypothetical protein
MKISRLFHDKVKNEVLKHLGLKDYFQLNDKLDGVFYFKKVLKNSIGIDFFEKQYQVNLGKNSFLNSNPVFNFNGDRIYILTIFFDEKIFIPDLEVDYFFVFGVSRDFFNGKFLGKVSMSKINLLKSEKVNTGVLSYLCEFNLSDLEK